MLKIHEPFHGAVLHHGHGRQTEDGLAIRVKGEAPLGDRVMVAGVAAHRAGTHFEANVTLGERENEIGVVSDGPGGHLEHRVRVLWDRHSRPRYRFSIDDNSFFLRDVAEQGYGSLFECPYLAIVRDLQQRYGAKFVLNVYYTTGDGFDLPQFPDRYRGEWRDNAHWLKLAFHARADLPARPYQYASPETLLADWQQVDEQIVRFAGQEVCSPPTVIHWGMVQPAALRPLYEHGVRTLSGFFTHRQGVWDVNYWLDDTRSEYLSRHDALMDFDSGIVFSNVDLVCNSTPIDHIESTLEAMAADPHRVEIVDLFTHEQYFWPFYSNYLPDHAQRLDTAIRWVTERGYEPVFFHEGLLGGPDWGDEGAQHG